MYRWTILSLILLAGFYGQAGAQTVLFVTPYGTGPGTITSPAGLQPALDSASHDPDDVEIRVAQGTYYGNFECIYDTLLSKDMEMTGGWMPDFSSRVLNPENTILDGQNTGRVLKVFPYFKRTPGSVILEGFTLRNGHSTNGSGGGLQLQTFAPGEIIINRNIIENNRTQSSGQPFYHGGGMYVSNFDYDNQIGGNVTISNNIIRDNIAGLSATNGQGGGIFAYCTDTLFIYNNIITGNISDEFPGNGGASGGGIEVYALQGEVIIVNNTITGNTSSLSGGGIHTHVTSPAWDNVHFHLYNNIIRGNFYDGWLGDTDIMSAVSSINPGPGNTITVAYTDYSGLGEWPDDCVSTKLISNKNVDPQFKTGGYSLVKTSECINAGTNDAPFIPETDFTGKPRILGDTIDMGAYEYYDGVVEIPVLSAFRCNETITLLSNDYTGIGLAVYNIYRGTSSPAGELYKTVPATDYPDTVLVDTVTYGQTWYYRISAVDTSAVESALSNEVSISVNKALDLGPDIEMCAGESVRLDAGSGFLEYQWSVPDSTSRYLTVSTTGEYSIEVTGDHSCHSFDTVVVDVYSDVDVDLGDTLFICPDSSLVLRPGSGHASYLWSDGSTGDTLIVDEPGIYSVTVTTGGECGGFDEVVVETMVPCEDEEICMVTVSNTNRLLIVWEKTCDQGVAAYRIYRRGLTGFDLIGEVPFDNLSVFLDETSLPDQMFYEYRITAVDICGNESEKSDIHRSIHLDVHQSLNGMGLIWTEYIGYEYTFYHIYRGSSYLDLHKYLMVPYTNLTVVDENPPDGLVYYRIGANKTEPCYPSAKKSVVEEYEMAMSNVDDNEDVGIDQAGSVCSLRIYPNPASDHCTIRFFNPDRSNYLIHLMSLDGKVVRILDQVSSDRINLELDDLQPGYYWIRIYGSQIFQGELIVY